MALNKNMEEVVAAIKDPKEQESLRKSFEAHPELQERFEGNLRQQEFDRQMNENKEKMATNQAELETGRENIKTYQEWYERNKGKHDTTLAAYEALQKEKAGLEAELAAKTGDADVDLEGEGLKLATVMAEVETKVGGMGFVKQDDIKALAEQERTDFFDKTLPGVVEFNAQLNDVQFRHRDEFDGKPLDRKAFGDFMKEKEIRSPADAYEPFVMDAKWAKEKTKIEEDARADERSKMNVPGTTAPPADLGAVEMLRRGQGPEGIPDNAIPGDGQAASAAAKALREEGKF